MSVYVILVYISKKKKKNSFIDSRKTCIEKYIMKKNKKLYQIDDVQ